MEFSCYLVIDEYNWTTNLERIVKVQNGMDGYMPRNETLEINSLISERTLFIILSSLLFKCM